jgi:hypothetical protein
MNKIKSTPESSPFLSLPCEDSRSWKSVSILKKILAGSDLDLGIPVSRTVRNALLLLKPPVLWYCIRIA